MGRKGYKTISISEEVYELINELKKKYRMSTTELLKTALTFFDEVMDKCREIRSYDNLN
ncbi:MAG: hypothetical protein DRN04_16505 [Thermoprotei archaeon]|nr:MAG: hypothetical protein DRN04_16505 [Thermoprotei archaeon]